MMILAVLLSLGAVTQQGPSPCHDYDTRKEKANCACALVPQEDGRCVIRHDPEESPTRCMHDCVEQAYCQCHADMCEWAAGPRMNDFKMQHMKGTR